MATKKEIVDGLLTLLTSGTRGDWAYSERSIRAADGRLVARIPVNTPEQVAAADAEFIVAMRNNAWTLLGTIRHLLEKEERLLRRIERLETELHGG